MNQILAYRISAEVKKKKKTFTKKRKPQIESQYTWPKWPNPHFVRGKKCPQKFCLLVFKEIQSEFFQGINPACEIFLLTLNNMSKD